MWAWRVHEPDATGPSPVARGFRAWRSCSGPLRALLALGPMLLGAAVGLGVTAFALTGLRLEGGRANPADVAFLAVAVGTVAAFLAALPVLLVLGAVGQRADRNGDGGATRCAGPRCCG